MARILEFLIYTDKIGVDKMFINKIKNRYYCHEVPTFCKQASSKTTISASSDILACPSPDDWARAACPDIVPNSWQISG